MLIQWCLLTKPNQRTEVASMFECQSPHVNIGQNATSLNFFLQKVSLFCLFGCDQELMMEIKWVGRYYTIAVNLDGTVGDLKNAIFEAIHVQPQLQRVR